MSSYKPSSQQNVMPTRRMRKTTIMSNFIHHQVIEKTNKQKNNIQQTPKNNLYASLSSSHSYNLQNKL